jgi:hypothetical protein
MAKQYKNVYTILEKVKKGEIQSQSYYKDRDGLFGKINFYKKPDLIKPHMHWLDERRMENIMDEFFSDQRSIKDTFQKFEKSASYAKITDPTKKPDFNQFYSKVRDNYRNFPKHFAKDIFKMFYHRMENLEFEERTDKNHSKFRFLERANNPVAKIMTEGSNLKSAIFARNIMGAYLTMLTTMDYVDPETSDKIKKGACGEGSGDMDGSGNDDFDQAMKDMMDSARGKSAMNEALDKATDLCNQMDDAMDDDTQEQMFEQASDAGGNNAGKLSPDYVKQVAASLKSIRMSMGPLKESLKKLLDKSASYFSSKKEVIYEDIFNSDNVSEIEDYVLLHPKLRKLFVEDIYTKDQKSVGKIDVYIDISGSMSSGCGVEDEDGRYISRIDFCKSMVAKLSEMDMLNNVYTFDNRVKSYKKDPISIAMLGCGGGTTIDAAVRSVDENGVNAIILTDAEDSCYIYSEKAFFIGLKGAKFNHFDNEIIKEYSNKDQVVVFDGSSIKKVNQQGYIFK